MKNNKIIKLLCFAFLFSAIFSMAGILPKNTSAEEYELKGVNVNDYQLQEFGAIDDINEISFYELLQTYTNRSNSYTASDGIFPEYYTMIEGNGTDEYGVLSEDYGTYMMYVQDQNANGLCWDFAGTQSITTTIMKHTGEYVDFSEAWVSLVIASATSEEGNYEDIKDLMGSYVPGDGGNFFMYDAATRIQGLVLEQDYEYAKSYYPTQDETNFNSNAPYLLEFYSQYASKTFLENYISVTFNIYDSTNQEQVINSMKKHIINHGSISAGMFWGAGEYLDDVSKYNSSICLKTADANKNSGTTSGHAVSIIGWDDTYNNGEGAWIALNSWGEDAYNGLVYLEYDDSDFNTFHGYEYNPEIYKTKYLASNDNLIFKNTISNSNAVGAKTPTGLTTDQKNIFYQQDDVELEYIYELSDGATVDDVKIYYRNEVQNVEVNFNANSHTFKFKINNANLGSYKVAIYYSDNDQSKVYYNSFIVTNGLEFGCIQAYDWTGSSTINSGVTQVFNTYICGEEINVTVATSLKQGELYVLFVKGSYSDVSYLEFGGQKAPMFTDGYYGNYIQVPYNFENSTQKKGQLMFTNEDSSFVRIVNLIILKVESSQDLVFMEYYLDGGINNVANLDKLAINTSELTEIGIPEKTGYYFKGWYYDAQFKNALTYSNEKYYIDYSNVFISGGNRYSSYEYCGIGETVSNLCLYAKWEKITYTVSFNTDGGSLIENLIVDENGKLARPEDPTKKGYVFKGWFKDAEFTTEFDFENEIITGNLTLYAKWEKSAFVIVFNTNGGSQIEELYVEKNEIITPPINPIKRGFTFDGWYQDEQLTQIFDFTTQITSDITLYAKWETAKPTDVEISSEAWQIIGKEFIINLKFSHELKNDELFTYKVKWYRNDVQFSENSALQIKDKLNEVGKYEYKAEVIAIYDGIESQLEISNIIEVSVVAPIEAISNVTYNGNGNIAWEDDNYVVDYFGDIYYAQYKVTLYQKEVLKDSVIKSISIDSEIEDKSLNFSEYLTNASAYRIGIIKSIGDTTVPEKYSEYFEIAIISYNCDTDENLIESQCLDVNSEVIEPMVLTKKGYTFAGWYYDSEFEHNVVFPFAISECKELVIYAKWKLNELICDIDGDLSNLVYDKNEHQIVMNASHELEYVTFEYNWFKLVEDNYESLNQKQNSFTVKTVAESGDYLCKITASDDVGRTTSKEIYFIVNILRADTEIIVEPITKKYVYNGYEQTINVKASLSRGNEEFVEIDITNNKFKDVPVEGYLDLIVSAPESNNYSSAQTQVRVPIGKASSTLFIENQKFTYNGEKVIPVGIISNEEQKDKIFFEGEDIINVGTYYRKAIVEETTNYLPIEKDVHIQVVPAVVQIKAKDITSLWLFGKKSFEYEIVEGQIYGDDNLNIEFICDVNTSIPNTYIISISASNENYYIGVVQGQYKVSLVPHIIILLTVILICVFIFMKHQMKPYVVEFEGEGVLLPTITVKNKDKLKIKQPTRYGYAFDGWYLDPALKTIFDGKFKRGTTKTLYAKWIKVDIPKSKDLEEKEIAKNFVDKLFVQTNNQPNEEIKNEEIFEEEQKQEESVQNNSEIDFINDIIKKATNEVNSEVNSNEDELKAFIDKISQN